MFCHLILSRSVGIHGIILDISLMIHISLIMYHLGDNPPPSPPAFTCSQFDQAISIFRSCSVLSPHGSRIPFCHPTQITHGEYVTTTSKKRRLPVMCVSRQIELQSSCSTLRSVLSPHWYRILSAIPVQVTHPECVATYSRSCIYLFFFASFLFLREQTPTPIVILSRQAALKPYCSCE